MSAFDLAKSLDLPELTKSQARLDKTIAAALTVDTAELAKPIGLLLSSPGKRLRPSLMLAVVQATGGKVNQLALRAAASVEILHLASLVHDDIIDRSETRHGSKTLSAQAGSSQALIVGDYLQAKAFEQVASTNQSVAQILASAFIDICIGQAQEQADLSNLKRTPKAYLNSVNGKTGALFSAACEIGGLYARLESSELKALKSFGQNFGLAFQLIDDVLDLIATPQLVGKPVGQDIPNGNYTLPIILALRSPLARKYQKLIEDPSIVTEALIQDGFIRQSIIQIKEINQSAADSLKNLGGRFSRFGSLAEQFLTWSLENLVDKAVAAQIKL